MIKIKHTDIINAKNKELYRMSLSAVALSHFDSNWQTRKVSPELIAHQKTKDRFLQIIGTIAIHMQKEKSNFEHILGRVKLPNNTENNKALDLAKEFNQGLSSK